MSHLKKAQLTLFAEKLLLAAKLSFFISIPLLLLMNYWSSLVREELWLSAQRRLELMEQRLEIIEMRVAKSDRFDTSESTEKKNLN